MKEIISNKAKKNLNKILPFGFFWFLFSLIYLFLEKGILGDMLMYPDTTIPYNFERKVIITLGSAIITGLLVGITEVLFLKNLFIKKSFTKKIILKSVLYLVLMIVFLLFNRAINATIELNTTFWNSKVWEITLLFISSFTFWSIQIYLATIIGLTLFYSEISDTLGDQVFLNFIKGKYHSPIEEDRIFMFLDMKSSTTIAEKLGHIVYFEFLKEYYVDLSNSILNYSGEIYQYVGDEVVISWKIKNGLKNNNFLKCFFAMKLALENQAKKYTLKYGIEPSFKAGIHSGKVTAGEIGILKKDIIYTGDVLNTSARIQSLCNTYSVDLLLSEHLIQSIEQDVAFQSIPIGTCELRGKSKKINLFTITQK